MDGFLRRATPIVLLLMAALAWFEKWLPGHEAMARRFGEDGVLRFVLGLLCVYMVLSVVERQRMEYQFKQLLGAFKDFHEQVRGAGGGAEVERKKLEAAQLLTEALASPQAEIRQKAAGNLKRLTGQDFGEDPDAWRAWLAQQPPAGGG
jgi:hypothetical protein